MVASLVPYYRYSFFITMKNTTVVPYIHTGTTKFQMHVQEDKLWISKIPARSIVS